jgi:hypothetical protein
MGVVARKPKGGKILLGYFFGPRRVEIPHPDEIETLKVGDATLVGLFGDLGLINGSWTLVPGPARLWNRADWPIPPLARMDATSSRASIIEYSDDLKEVLSTPTDAGIAAKLFKDGVMGIGFVEAILEKTLDT